MSGNVNPFVDFKTTADTGLDNSTSINPLSDGEQVTQTVLRRPDENLRQRTEVLRALGVDTLYLQNADRVLAIAGPGLVTWAGSTTAGQNGIPALSDVLWILPFLTPGSAQTQPVPPVASTFGTLHLKRASDSMDSIVVTSQRRSYAAGDQINVEIIAGSVYSCTLQTEDTGHYQRTIQVVATPTTTLGTVIASLNAVTPPSPDNTALVTAALEGGALNSDVILSPQTRQFVSGNYDGEGHTITPANLASFFTSNPTQALAEGDTLCVQFAMLNDTASTGGRRQAIPENSNTPITAGMFFNSRVHPEKLVNALPICKVVNGDLVFGTGSAVRAGSTAVSITGSSIPNILRWDPTTPTGEGTLYVERPDHTYDVNHLPPAAAIYGRILQLGSKLLASAPDARKPRISMPHSGTYDATLLWESPYDGTGSNITVRLYVSLSGQFMLTVNASYDGTNWNKDSTGSAAHLLQFARGDYKLFFRASDQNTAWSTWTQYAQWEGSQTMTGTAAKYDPMLQLFDSGGNRRVAFDHLGLPGGRVSEIRQEWLYDPYTYYTVPTLCSADNANGNPVGSHVRSFGSWILAASATPVYYPLKPQFGDYAWQGDVIIGYNISFQKNTNAAATVTADVVYFDSVSGAEHSLGMVATSTANAPGAINLQYSNGGEIVQGNRQYYIKITPSGSITPAADRIFDVQPHILRGDSQWVYIVAGGAFATPNVTGQQFALQTAGNAGSLAYVQTRNAVAAAAFGSYAPEDTKTCVLDFMTYSTSNFASASPGATARLGFYLDQGGGTTAGCYFAKVEGNANWQFMLESNGVVTQVDTGVAVAGSGTTRFRIEMYGASTPGGRRYIGYINGVPVASFDDTATTKPGTMMCIHFGVTRTTAVVTRNIVMGPVVYHAMPILGDDAL